MTPAKSPDAPAGLSGALSEDVAIAEAEIAEPEIAEVEVEEVSSVSVTRVTDPTARATGVWQFPDDFLDGDAPPGGAPEAAPVQAEPPATVASTAARERRKPPTNSGELLLGVLIALALVILLGLGAYLFFLVSPESYTALRARLPATWTFLPGEDPPKEYPPAGD